MTPDKLREMARIWRQGDERAFLAALAPELAEVAAEIAEAGQAYLRLTTYDGGGASAALEAALARFHALGGES